MSFFFQFTPRRHQRPSLCCFVVVSLEFFAVITYASPSTNSLILFYILDSTIKVHYSDFQRYTDQLKSPKPASKIRRNVHRRRREVS